MWQLNTRARAVLDAVKGAIDVRGDVGEVLDPDGDAQKPVRDAEALSLLGREAAVRRYRRIQHLGEKNADRGRGSGEVQGIEKKESRVLAVVAGHEGKKATPEAP